MGNKITQKEVALAVGISQPVVSDFLNNPHTSSLSREKKELIYSYLRENRLKFNGKTKDTVGIIFPGSRTDTRGYDPEALHEFYMHVNHRCRQLGKKAIIYNDMADIEEFLNVSCLEVNGLMLLNAVTSEQVKRLQKHHHVLIKNQETEELLCDTVNSDVKAGIRGMVGFLAEMNHRRIAFFGISAPGNVYSENFYLHKKQEGYFQGVRNRKLEYRENYVKIFEAKKQTIEEINEFALEALNSWEKTNDMPTAVIAANDNYAFSFIRVAEQKGYSIPDDFSVTGFDNTRMCAIFRPRLTSIAWDGREIARTCVDTLIRRMEGEKSRPKKIIIPVDIVKRDSVKKLNQVGE